MEINVTVVQMAPKIFDKESNLEKIEHFINKYMRTTRKMTLLSSPN